MPLCLLPGGSASRRIFLHPTFDLPNPAGAATGWAVPVLRCFVDDSVSNILIFYPV